MDDISKLKKNITNSFKLSGFIIHSENSSFLAEKLLPYDKQEREKWLTVVIENIQEQRLPTVSINHEVLVKAIKDINQLGLDEGETIFSLIDAFTIPRFDYNMQSKKFERNIDSRDVLNVPSLKANHLRQRYAMLLQKTLRHELFSPSIIEGGVSAESQTKRFKLLFTENLLASSSEQEVVVLGLLTQLKEGEFYIEDCTGCVKLDLNGTRFHSGFFCEGCFVLAEGSYTNGILKVDGFGFPPAELASSSRAFFGIQNSWGGESIKLLKYSVQLQEVERKNLEATIVFLSDARLDLPIVQKRLRQLFVGYNSCPPVAIVLMGPFDCSHGSKIELQNRFTNLGNLANGCDQLKKSTDLILIPACEDPTAPNVLPRAPLPESLVTGLRKVWQRTLLATNPCRLQYCTQQIVVCRLDMMAKFCRNTLHFPTNTELIHEYFSRTLICQGHLIPFHQNVQPVHCSYDTSLWLYPLPDLVVIGDSCQPFTTTQHCCSVINTGSFVKSKFSFKVYLPATRTIEDSEITDDIDQN